MLEMLGATAYLFIRTRRPRFVHPRRKTSHYHQERRRLRRFLISYFRILYSTRICTQQKIPRSVQACVSMCVILFMFSRFYHNSTCA